MRTCNGEIYTARRLKLLLLSRDCWCVVLIVGEEAIGCMCTDCVRATNSRRRAVFVRDLYCQCRPGPHALSVVSRTYCTYVRKWLCAISDDFGLPFLRHHHHYYCYYCLLLLTVELKSATVSSSCIFQCTSTCWHEECFACEDAMPPSPACSLILLLATPSLTKYLGIK